MKAAFEVLDAAGIDGLTVRAVAARLGVKAPALYWHFAGKQELLDEMATDVWRRTTDQMLALAPAMPWRERMRAFADITRRALLAHRDGAKAFSGTYLTDSAVLERQEANFSVMIEQGFTLAAAVRAYLLLYAFTVGFCIEEQAVAQAAAAGDERYSLARRAERVDAERYPLVAQSGAEIFGDPDARFAELVASIVESVARPSTGSG